MGRSTGESTMVRAPEEQAIIDGVAELRGEEWAEEHAELILDQARHVGELRDGDSEADP